MLTSDARAVGLRVTQEHDSGLAVQRVRGVRVPQQLREEHVEDVHEVWKHTRAWPNQATTNSQFARNTECRATGNSSAAPYQTWATKSG